MLQSPLECPNNILKTLRWPWFRPKVGKRIEWVRLFWFRRNLSLVMIGLVWKVVGPKCRHGFLTNGWKRWLATQPGHLHPLIFLSHILYCSLFTCWWELFNHFKLRNYLLTLISRRLFIIIGLFGTAQNPNHIRLVVWSHICMIDQFIYFFGILSILLILDTVLMIFWNCLERKWFWGRLGEGNSNFSEVGSFGWKGSNGGLSATGSGAQTRTRLRRSLIRGAETGQSFWFMTNLFPRLL